VKTISILENLNVSIHYTMSISGQNLSVVIVTLKSENVVHECIKSINIDIPIIVIENSNNRQFKEKMENTYKNLRCVLSNTNIGMGAGNNIGIKLASTDYVLILNPDTVLEPNALNEIFLAEKKIPDFSILSPITTNTNYPNYKIFGKKNISSTTHSPFKVDYVDGFSMLINKKKFKNEIYFDENFFLYLENDDLCLRSKRLGGSIYIVPTSKINHHGAKTVDAKYREEIELSRNWHWVWSKYYFNKKNFGIIKALKECLPTYISAIMKYFFYLIVGNKYKKKLYFNRVSGFYNSLLGKSSWYRPNLKD